MNTIIKLNDKGKVTSINLVEEINMFRAIDDKSKIRHDNLLEVIRDEFEEEISLQEIQESKYINSRGKEYPMFELTLEQAKQVLVRESSTVRKAVLSNIKQLEQQNAKLIEAGKVVVEAIKLPGNYKEALVALLGQVEANETLSIELSSTTEQLTDTKNSKRATKAWVTKKDNLISKVQTTLGCKKQSDVHNVVIKTVNQLSELTRKIDVLEEPMVTSSELANVINVTLNSTFKPYDINQMLICMNLAQRGKDKNLHLTMTGREFGMIREFATNGTWAYYPIWKREVTELLLKHIYSNKIIDITEETI